MTEQSRRAFLAAGAGALAATAGCSRLPSFRNSESSPSYDTERLRAAADPDAVTVQATHPGPVPNGLADAHYERARALLDDVPSEPSIPNGVVAGRIADDRERTAESTADSPSEVATLDALDEWRRDRADAAEVRGAYAAATGDADPEGLEERRDAVRSDLRAFDAEWAYRGRSVAEAVAVHKNVEALATRAGDALVPDRSFPADPKAAVFEVGSLVRGVENARAAAADAAGLRDAYVGEEMAGYGDAIATAVAQLEYVTDVTSHRVDPYLAPDAGVDDFERDVDGTPAGWLFRRARSSARSSTESAASAVERDDYATAVVQHGRALVAVLALESVVNAIRDGEYGTPASADEVLDARERAVDALADTETVEPRPLADALAVRARSALHYADRELVGHPDSDSGAGTTDRDVVDATGGYALAVHAANAIPPVVERLVAELRAATGGENSADGT